MNLFIDSEFIERPWQTVEGVRYPGTIDLISIGIVGADGRELYEISSEFNAGEANEWVRVNVLSKLPTEAEKPRKTQLEIRASINEFLADDPNPTFWGYFSSYDHVAFAWLFGRMIDLPSKFPMYCLDVAQAMKHLGMQRKDLPPAPVQAHDALVDAHWTKKAWGCCYRRAQVVAPGMRL